MAILTGEVSTYASLWARVAAYSLDMILLFAGIMASQALLRPINPLLGRTPRTTGWLLHLWVYASVSLPILLYFALCISSKWQATLGMRWLGIKVTTLGGESLGIGPAVLRSLVMLIPFELNHIVMFYPTPIWSDPKPGFRYGFIVTSVLMVVYLASVLLTEHHQSIHDLFARTIVVRVD
jgi:uncharacterized RDD family membrane protein YckC